jgi:ubiquinone/menaquinone biosynthesis C-methylase UbiE
LYTGTTTETFGSAVLDDAAISVKHTADDIWDHLVRSVRVDADEIRQFWELQAAQHRSSHRASWSDRGVIELEITAIGSRLSPGWQVLDVGCANGFSSFRYAVERDVDVTGVDFAPGMIEAADAARSAQPADVQARTRFGAGDIRALDFQDATFDAVVSTRVIINLPNAEEQLAGLAECARVLRPGGVLLLSEATQQGWQRLNALRREWGFSEIPIPPFNLYLDETVMRSSLKETLNLIEIVDFASSYYVVTRLLKPLLAQATEYPIDVSDPDAEFNRWAASLPAAGDYGTQKLFVFRRF